MRPTAKKSNTNCSVFGCSSRKSKDKSVHFHSFPKISTSFVQVNSQTGIKEKIDRRIAWAQALSIQKPVTDGMRVCSKHFKQEDYCAGAVIMKQPKLKKNAVPSLNLPRELFLEVPQSQDYDHDDTPVVTDRSRFTLN